MWPFKKEENVENLIKDCNKLYASFSYSLGKAHYKSYSDLKFLMKENFKIMREKIGTEQDEEIKSSIYTWWHTGLPEKIKEGFLNQA